MRISDEGVVENLQETPAAPVAPQDQLRLLEEQLRTHLLSGSERLRETCELDSAGLLSEELHYLAGHIEEALNRPSEPEPETLLRAAGYLGAETFELQWALERGNLGHGPEFGAGTLDAQTSYEWTEAVQRFDSGDAAGARAAFAALSSRAELKPAASQYLGVLAMSEGDLKEAVKQFEQARRLAANDQERALASCHLGRAWFAAGDAMRAAKCALSAAEADPSKGRFWYEAAAYCARLDQPEHFSDFLASAIRCDWVYWAIAAADAGLDPVRPQVMALLDEIRDEQKRLARVQLDKLHNIITTLGDTEARGEVLSALKLVHNLEDQFREANFFSYAAVQNAAVASQRNVIERALTGFDSRIRMLEGALAEAAKPPSRTKQMQAMRREASAGSHAGVFQLVETLGKIWSSLAMLASTYWAALAIVTSGREQARAIESLKFWGLLLIIPGTAVYGFAYLKRKFAPARQEVVVEAPQASEEEQRAALADQLDRVQKLRETLAEYLQTLPA